MYSKLLFIVALAVACCLADNVKPPTITLQPIIYDHHPSKNKNFEPPLTGGGVTKNLVEPILNQANRIPVHRAGITAAQFKNAHMPDPASFPQFFQNVPGVNLPVNYDLKFTLQSDGTYLAAFPSMFPIDNQGWDNQSKYPGMQRFTGYGTYHNFHYCLRLNSLFTYQGYETYKFEGDDDVWVYINNTLVVDLGGIHTADTGSVDLKTMNLIVGRTYNFDFFYCERHTEQSTLRVQTNIEVFCAFKDYCGVCNGDGSACCLASRDCNDNNPCTDDACPKPNQEGTTIDNWRGYCINKPKECAQTTKCSVYGCVAGTCQVTGPTVCPHAPCRNETCDNTYGCKTVDTCVRTDMCETVACSTDGKEECLRTPVNCDLGDPCMDYSCDGVVGCLAIPKNCVNDTNICTSHQCVAGQCITTDIPAEECQCDCKPNLCQEGKCNVATGLCDLTPLPSIDSKNKCMIDFCHESNGTITHTPIICDGCSVCVEGACVDTTSLCEDNNVCTTDLCSETNCTHTPISCDDNDVCTIDSCDAVNGCVHTPVTCPGEGNCQVGVCNPGIGCGLAPRECPSDNFCTVSQCDEALGCISFDRNCVADNPKCQSGRCNNVTQECESHDYDPKPFICKTAAVISTAVVAAIVVAAAVALALAVFGGKKGYDHWKSTQNQAITNSVGNPLYETNPSTGDNPLYDNDTNL
eukprot:gene4403-5153_t